MLTSAKLSHLSVCGKGKGFSYAHMAASRFVHLCSLSSFAALLAGHSCHPLAWSSVSPPDETQSSNHVLVSHRYSESSTYECRPLRCALVWFCSCNLVQRRIWINYHRKPTGPRSSSHDHTNALEPR